MFMAGFPSAMLMTCLISMTDGTFAAPLICPPSILRWDAGICVMRPLLWEFGACRKFYALLHAGAFVLEFYVCLRTEAICLVALGSVQSARGDGLGRHCCRPQRPLAYGSRRLLSCAVGGAVAFPPIPPPSVRTYVLLRIDR